MRFRAAVVSLVLATGVVDAQPARRDRAVEAQARALFERGVAAVDELRWADAAEAFAQSQAALPRPATLRNLALAHRALGRYTQAIEEFERFLAGNADAAMGREVRRIVAEMRGRLASLTLDVAPTDAALRVDGRSVPAEEPIALDPGEHAVAASAAGHEAETLAVTLEPGERRRLHLDLPRATRAPVGPAPEAPPRAVETSPGLHTRWWFWTLLGAVVAGAVVTTVLLVDQPADPGCGTLDTCLTPR